MMNLNYLMNLYPILKNIPTAYDDCLTTEEQIYWLYNYIQKTLIPAHNDNAEAIEELQNIMDTLQPYVNNKLNQMYEEGKFQEAIESQVFTDFTNRLSSAEGSITSIDNELIDINADIVENTQNININSTNIGTIENLTTESTNLVGAINELNNEVVLSDTITINQNSSIGSVVVDLPDNFDNTNCMIVSVGFKQSLATTSGYIYSANDTKIYSRINTTNLTVTIELDENVEVNTNYDVIVLIKKLS